MWDDCGGAGGDGSRGDEGEEAVCVTFLSWKSKLGMNEVALFEYFNTRLEEMTQCANKEVHMPCNLG